VENKLKNKNLYILPNLFTSVNFFCGILSMTFALKGEFYIAAWVIVAGMLFDFLDGQVARLVNATSRFGVEYDSLADLVTFGIAPTILMYTVVLKDINRIGIAVAFIYSVCCALRLARFNLNTVLFEKRNFVGLPTPAASGFLASVILLRSEFPWLSIDMVLPFFMLFLSFLMVSNIKYPALKSMIIVKGKPFINLVTVVLGTSIAIFHTELFLFFMFLFYVVYGLLREIHYYTRARRFEKRLNLERKRAHEK